MARRPTAADVSRVPVPGDPGVNIPIGMGATVGRGVVALGGGVEAVGDAFRAREIAARDAEDRARLLQLRSDLAIDGFELAQQSRSEVEGLPEGYTDRTVQGYDRLAQERISQLPSRLQPDARAVAAGLRSSYLIDQKTWEHDTRVNTLTTQMSQALDQMSIQASRQPDRVFDFLDTTDEWLRLGREQLRLPAEDLAKLRQDKRQAIATAALKGMSPQARIQMLESGALDDALGDAKTIQTLLKEARNDPDDPVARDAVFAWLERQDSYSAAFHALERNELGDSELNDYWMSLPAESRNKIRSQALKNLNERLSLDRQAKEANEAALETANEGLVRQFFETDDFRERTKLLREMEDLGIVKGERLKSLRDFHEAAPLAARDDPLLAQELRTGVLLGDFGLAEIELNADRLTPQTTQELLSIWQGRQDKKLGRAIGFLRSSFGVLEDTVISSKASEAAATAAGQAIADLVNQMDKTPEADPMALARKLIEEGGEGVKVMEREALRFRLELFGNKVPGFDVNNPEASLEEAIANGSIEADSNEAMVLQAIIDEMKRKEMLSAQPQQ